MNSIQPRSRTRFFSRSDVEDVVPRVALVAGEIEGAVDEDGQVRVHLDEAAVVLPGTSCSRSTTFPVTYSTVKRLLGRQRQVPGGHCASGGDRRAEDGVEPRGRNDEVSAERIVALGERARAGQRGFQARHAGARKCSSEWTGATAS